MQVRKPRGPWPSLAMLRAIVAVVLQLLLVLTLSRQAAGQAAAHLDGAQTHGHAHIRAAEGSQLALDFLTLADGLLRERKRRAPHFTATVTYASLMASIRSEAEFRALYRLTHSEYIDLHKKICQHDPTYSGTLLLLRSHFVISGPSNGLLRKACPCP